jgi:hypothetical protein
MNAAQQNAIAKFKSFLTSRDNGNYSEGIPVELTAFEPRVDGGMVFVSAQTDMGKEGTMLRALSHEHWLLIVGKRGAVTVKMGPRSLKQFNGRKFLGMNISI